MMAKSHFFEFAVHVSRLSVCSVGAAPRWDSSRLTIPAMVDLQLTPMTNPVTGADELATLYKPTGFTSKTHELCATRTYRVTLDGLAYDHSGKYGEFSPFEYAPA